MALNKGFGVKAFTIMEVTITMLITAIVIGITYTAYSIISRSFISFKAKNEDMALIVRVDHLLKRDFEQADIILTDNSGFDIKKTDSTVLHYEIMPAYIVRKSITVDTFKVATQDFKLYFEHLDKAFQDPNNKENNRIDEISFTINYKDGLIPFHYSKVYSSENLIQRNPNAVN